MTVTAHHCRAEQSRVLASRIKGANKSSGSARTGQVFDPGLSAFGRVLLDVLERLIEQRVACRRVRLDHHAAQVQRPPPQARLLELQAPAQRELDDDAAAQARR